jgi:hypothetical protein
MINNLQFKIGNTPEVSKQLTTISDDRAKVNKPYETYNLHMKKILDIPEEEPIYIYGGQKLNFYNMQKAD